MRRRKHRNERCLAEALQKRHGEVRTERERHSSMTQERLRQRQGTAYRRRAGRRGSASSYRGGKDCEQSLAQQHAELSAKLENLVSSAKKKN